MINRRYSDSKESRNKVKSKAKKGSGVENGIERK